jgi:hypothetical protein
MTSGDNPSFFAADFMAGVMRPASAASRCVMEGFYLK